MSTVIDYGSELGTSLTLSGDPSGPALDTTQTAAGLPTFTSTRVSQNWSDQSEYVMTGITNMTGLLGTVNSQLGSIVLEGTIAVVDWFSYNDALNDGPPVPVPLINVSAARIR